MATTAIRRSRARVVALVVTAVVVVVVALALARAWRGTTPDEQANAEVVGGTPVADANLAAIADSAVFFGHQSVGRNILDGVSAVYAAEGLEPPVIVESGSAPSAEAAFAHARVGKNTDPLSKMADFAGLLRSGYGQWAESRS